MEFTAFELYVMHTGIGNTSGASMADARNRDRLLDALEFTDDEKAAIGWHEVLLDNGSYVPVFRDDAILERTFTEVQMARMRAILTSPDAVSMIKARVFGVYEAALTKIGWVDMEEDA